MNTEGKIRETVQWDLNTDSVYLRYDFAYIDPASGWHIQIGVDYCSVSSDTKELDECIVPVARATIENMLKRKCGVARALEGRLELLPPRTTRCRFV